MASWLIGLLALLAGVGIGYLLFQNLERRKTGGKTAAEIMQEHEQYREEVQEHFTKTSDLFQSMTMQYRELYDHLSEGAQSLCDTIPASPALDLSDKALLPGADPGHGPGGSPADRPVSNPVSNVETKPGADIPARQAAWSDEDSVATAGSTPDDDEFAIGADASISVDTNVHQPAAGNTASADSTAEADALADTDTTANESDRHSEDQQKT